MASIDIRAARPAQPNRTIERDRQIRGHRDPTASAAHERPGSSTAPTRRSDGRRHHLPRQRRRRLDLHERQALALRRHGDEKRRRDQGPGRLGAPRPAAADDSGAGGPGPRAGLLPRPAAEHRVHRDDLSRPEGQLRLQRRDDLVVRRPCRAARLHAAGGPRRHAPGPDPRVQRITTNLFRRFLE